MDFYDGSNIDSSKVNTKLLRGMFISRPVKKRLAPCWGLSEILCDLVHLTPHHEPLHRADLPDLAKKTLFLVAAASVRHSSCLQALTADQGHTADSRTMGFVSYPIWTSFPRIRLFNSSPGKPPFPSSVPASRYQRTKFDAR